MPQLDSSTTYTVVLVVCAMPPARANDVFNSQFPTEFYICFVAYKNNYDQIDLLKYGISLNVFLKKMAVDHLK